MYKTFSIVGLTVALMVSFLLQSCTYATIQTEEMTATYMDFHPGGNAVNATVDWEGVGSMTLSRGTESSAETVGIIADTIEKVANPVQIPFKAE